MTVGRAAAAPAAHLEDHSERLLASRIIDTLLREGYGGLSGRVRCHDGSAVLDLPVSGGGPGRTLPLERDGFLADFRLRRTPAGLPVAGLTLDDVDAAIAAVSDPLDSAGVAAFAGECRQALAALRLRERHRPVTIAGLGRAGPAASDAWSGYRGLPGYEAVAACRPHPAYPTSESRLGFSDEDTLRYAPEYRPEFELRWVAVPRSRLTTSVALASRPAGWPALPEVGLDAALAATHELLPVHPLTARDRLADALAEAGLSRPGAGAEAAVIAPGAGLLVTPTLSTRTVVIVGQPDTHLKLPIPTSTLGLLNRRSIVPGTLADGALVRGLVATARERDPLLRGLLPADESSYAHAGHPFLGYLLRRLPVGLDQHRIVPVAALLAPSPNGRCPDGGPRQGDPGPIDESPGDTDPVNAVPGRPLVIEELAGWAWDGDLAGLFTGYLRLLFGVQVRLFARYGIALESHQQNAALTVGPPAVLAGRLGLLVKDFDGALVHLPRLRSALGPGAPEESAFADPRLVTTSDDALADVFITITLHLCAGALAFGLARRGVAPLPDLLALVRRELTAALDRHDGWPGAALLRARVLDADRLPGKSMVTAGTLVAKSRTGASDINKFYGTSGPNYLKDAFMRSCR